MKKSAKRGTVNMDIVKGVIPVLVLSSLSLTTISGFRSGSLGGETILPPGLHLSREDH